MKKEYIAPQTAIITVMPLTAVLNSISFAKSDSGDDAWWDFDDTDEGGYD